MIIEEISSERERQKSVEGWTESHDDQYKNQELARAAVSYACPNYLGSREEDLCPGPWPWTREWWKPTSYRRNLIKAAALIVAEIERIDRTGGCCKRDHNNDGNCDRHPDKE